MTTQSLAFGTLNQTSTDLHILELPFGYNSNIENICSSKQMTKALQNALDPLAVKHIQMSLTYSDLIKETAGLNISYLANQLQIMTRLAVLDEIVYFSETEVSQEEDESSKIEPLTNALLVQGVDEAIGTLITFTPDVALDRFINSDEYIEGLQIFEDLLRELLNAGFENNHFTLVTTPAYGYEDIETAQLICDRINKALFFAGHYHIYTGIKMDFTDSIDDNVHTAIPHFVLLAVHSLEQSVEIAANPEINTAQDVIDELCFLPETEDWNEFSDEILPIPIKVAGIIYNPGEDNFRHHNE